MTNFSHDYMSYALIIIILVVPWGRLVPLRPDLTAATLLREEGGNGNAKEFWEWNEKQVKNYL